MVDGQPNLEETLKVGFHFNHSCSTVPKKPQASILGV